MWVPRATVSRTRARSSPSPSRRRGCGDEDDYELIKAQGLAAYPDDAVRLAISRAVALETSRGWKITKEKSSHKIDVVIAIAMAAYAAVQKGERGFMRVGTLSWFRKGDLARCRTTSFAHSNCEDHRTGGFEGKGSSLIHDATEDRMDDEEFFRLELRATIAPQADDGQMSSCIGNA